jgi:hypothetical protein
MEAFGREEFTEWFFPADAVSHPDEVSLARRPPCRRKSGRHVISVSASALLTKSADLTGSSLSLTSLPAKVRPSF